MNPKIFVAIAVAVIGIVIALIATSGTSFVNELSERGLSPQEEPFEIIPITITVDDIRLSDLTRKGATLELVATVSNPNPKSIILTMIKYTLYEDGEKITSGQIGFRPEGMVEGSNYYTILAGNEIILRDKIELKNSGNAPEFWSALEQGNAKWRVTGEAFFNLSSMTSGQENEVFFEQSLP